jgi:hypothetical protein
MNQKGFANIILVVVIVVLVGAVGYFTFVKKSGLIVQQPAPTPAQTNTPVSPTPTPKNETANWKTYVDDKNHFSFNYPLNWSLSRQTGDSSDNLLLKNEAGKSAIYIAPHLRNLNYDYQNTLEKYIKSAAGGEYMGIQKVENVLLEKIVDTDQTLGYLSQWKIFAVDKTFIETRADFESKLETPSITATGKYRTVFSLVGQQGFDDLNLFKLVASTFHFNR